MAYIFSIVIIEKKVVSTEIFQFSLDLFGNNGNKGPSGFRSKKKIHSRKGYLKGGSCPKIF